MLERAFNKAQRTLALADRYPSDLALLRAASGIESWVSMAREAGPMDEQDEQDYAYEILARCTDVLLLIAD